MVREIAEILKQLGWTDGFRIPVSNEENKKLENMVEAKLREKAQLVADSEEMNERLQALQRHTKNVSEQHAESQKLLAANRRQLEDAEHLLVLVQGEHDSLLRELKYFKLTHNKVCNKNKKSEEEIKKETGKVLKLKQLMRWNSEELLAWKDVHTRKGEDLALLDHFIDEDDIRFKELEMKRVALQGEVEKMRIVAEETTTEVAMLEQVLDRVGQLYRQAHRDHRSLIHQWETSVQALHIKDKDINDALNEILEIRTQGRLKMIELLEAKELNANLKNNNAETVSTTIETEKKLNILQIQNQDLQKNSQELESELNILKRNLTTMGSQLKDRRIQNKRMKENVVERDRKVLSLQIACENLAHKLEEANKNVWDSGQRSRHMEELVKEEEHLQECFHQNINRLQSTYFRTTQELQAMREKEKLQILELNCIEKNKASMLKHMEVLDKELFKLKEIVYELEFSEQKLRSRIDHAMGDSKSADYEENIKKIEQLKTVLQEKQSTLALLTSQAERLENDFRQMTNTLSESNAELEKLQSKRQDGILLVEGGKKQLKEAKAMHQDRMVELALLRLRVSQVEKALRRHDSQVNSLSKQRVEMESIMKERQLEISLHKEMLMNKRKTLNEERSQLTASLIQMKTKLSQLQNRYDIAVSLMGKDESGEFITPALLKLKSAQEKMFLQQEGDILDAKIQKAEKEIEAMENTLKVVNTSNDTYRKSLTMIDKDGPEGDELRAVEESYYQAMMSLRAKRQEQAEVEATIQELSAKLEEIGKQEQEARASQKELDIEAASFNKDLQDQDLKLHRAESQLKRLVRDLRNKSSSTMFAMEEKDIALRELIDQNQSALQQLTEMSIKFIETSPVIVQLLKEKGLSLPQPGQHLRAVGSTSTLSDGGSAESVRSSSTSVSSCTAARKLIFDPALQSIGSFHGTMQTPKQLIFPLTRDTCCAPHSAITLGSMSESLTASTLADVQVLESSPQFSQKSSFVESQTISASILSASTEASVTTDASQIKSKSTKSSQSKGSGSKSKDSSKRTLQTISTVEPLLSISSGKESSLEKSSTKGSQEKQKTHSRTSSEASSKASKSSKRSSKASK